MSNYRKNDYEDIEKLFYQDSFHKKKIGSNVHKMTGKGKKGGIKGGIQFAKHNFKRYEKNSRVQSGNLFDKILNIDVFKTYNKEFQRMLLQEWLIRFSKSKIQKEMGISETTLNKTISQLNVKRSDKIVLSKEEMAKAKENVIPYNRFKALDKPQKYELLLHYNDKLGYTMRQLSDIWDNAISPNSLNTTKSKLKKELQAMGVLDENGQFVEPLEEDKEIEVVAEEDTPYVTDELDDLFGISLQQEKNKEARKQIKVDNITNVQPKSKNVNESAEPFLDTFNINIDGEYTGKELTLKAQSLIALLDQHTRYRVSIQIEDIGVEMEFDTDYIKEMLQVLADKIDKESV